MACAGWSRCGPSTSVVRSRSTASAAFRRSGAPDAARFPEAFQQAARAHGRRAVWRTGNRRMPATGSRPAACRAGPPCPVAARTPGRRDGVRSRRRSVSEPAGGRRVRRGRPRPGVEARAGTGVRAHRPGTGGRSPLCGGRRAGTAGAAAVRPREAGRRPLVRGPLLHKLAWTNISRQGTGRKSSGWNCLPSTVLARKGVGRHGFRLGSGGRRSPALNALRRFCVCMEVYAPIERALHATDSTQKGGLS
jgi:hypothetical protein